LNTIQEVELYLLVYYSRGKKAAYRKMNIAVCGLESILGNTNQTTLKTNDGNTVILSKLTFEYEIGSGIDGSNTTFVIDSVGLLNKTNSLPADMYFYSTDQTNCPAYDCDIVTDVEYNETTRIVTSISANNRSSSLQLYKRTVT
jgi:hypothetical protein